MHLDMCLRFEFTASFSSPHNPSDKFAPHPQSKLSHQLFSSQFPSPHHFPNGSLSPLPTPPLHPLEVVCIHPPPVLTRAYLRSLFACWAIRHSNHSDFLTATEKTITMFCSISGTTPEEPVISAKTGHLFEKSIITKALQVRRVHTQAPSVPSPSPNPPPRARSFPKNFPSNQSRDRVSRLPGALARDGAKIF